MHTNRSPAFNWALFAGLAILFVLSQIWLNTGNLPGDAPAWELIVNILLISVPLILLYGGIALLAITARQRRSAGMIDHRLVKWLYWSPRVAGILIILFLSLFALDVFEQGRSIWEILVGLFMHLLPSFGLVAFLMIAWRREWLGFWVFLAAAAFFFVISVWGEPIYVAGNLLLFVGPLSIIALLFRANWDWRDDLRSDARLAGG